MPLYSFHCGGCDRIFDTLRPINERDDPAACAVCASQNTRRRLVVSFAHRTTGTRQANGQDVAEETGRGRVLRGSSAVRMEDSHQMTFEDVRIEGFDNGIVALNSSMFGKNLKFKGCNTAIYGRDSEVQMDGLDIE